LSDLEKTVQELEKRVARLEQAVYGRSGREAAGAGGSGSPSAVFDEQLVVEKVDEIGTQDLILLALLQKPRQTKAQIRDTLADWGKAFGSWFEGGNFSGRLVKAGLVKKDGESGEGGEDQYSLTKKDELEAEALIKKLQSG
jgi:hypothetical protein